MFLAIFYGTDKDKDMKSRANAECVSLYIIMFRFCGLLDRVFVYGKPKWMLKCPSKFNTRELVAGS